MSAPRSLEYTCPSCERRLRPVEGMTAATQVVKRTCRRCGERWQIVITPHPKDFGFVDVGTFTFLGRSVIGGIHADR
jgi:hypothetical protein